MILGKVCQRGLNEMNTRTPIATQWHRMGISGAVPTHVCFVILLGREHVPLVMPCGPVRIVITFV